VENARSDRSALNARANRPPSRGGPTELERCPSRVGKPFERSRSMRSRQRFAESKPTIEPLVHATADPRALASGRPPNALIHAAADPGALPRRRPTNSFVHAAADPDALPRRRPANSFVHAAADPDALPRRRPSNSFVHAAADPEALPRRRPANSFVHVTADRTAPASDLLTRVRSPGECRPQALPRRRSTEEAVVVSPADQPCVSPEALDQGSSRSRACRSTARLRGDAAGRIDRKTEVPVDRI